MQRAYPIRIKYLHYLLSLVVIGVLNLVPIPKPQDFFSFVAGRLYPTAWLTIFPTPGNRASLPKLYFYLAEEKLIVSEINELFGECLSEFYPDGGFTTDDYAISKT